MVTTATSESTVDEEKEDDQPLTEAQRQQLFEAAKSAMTRTS